MIHSTAIIDKSAVIGQNVDIGPYAVIGENVTIGDGTVIGAHATIECARIGQNCKIFSHASIGAAPQDLKYAGEKTIAIIGDGALSGGEALEGLNVAGSEINSNLIIVLNDNQQSISETHGGIYINLKELRDTKGNSSNNMFKAIGLDYIYEENGNDIESMIKVFEKVKDIDHPIVVHINTKKGKGYKLAEDNKENWHWTLPFDKETGIPTIDFGEGEDANN